MAKISGEGAKHLAVYLFAALQGQKKTKGRIRLESLLRSGKELKVFAVKNEDLPTFCKEAKRYGVLYCALRDKKNVDGLCDVMVRAEDASKINRIVERFKLATVDTASIKQEIANARSEKQPEQGVQISEQTVEGSEREASPPPLVEEEVREDFLDELLGKTEPLGEEEQTNVQPEPQLPVNEQPEQQVRTQTPLTEGERAAEQTTPYEHTSVSSDDSGKDSIEHQPKEKVSIRELLREIREENRAAEKKRQQLEHDPPLPRRKDRGKLTSGKKMPTNQRKKGRSK